MDSRPETYKHIFQVQHWIYKCVSNLIQRGHVHDASKLVSPELEIFNKHTPKLAKCEYGSDEYKESLEAIKPALEHHYAKNTHHPEHYVNGIDDMSLLDILEMLCDWKSASERNKNGNILKSLDHNKERYNIDNQLYKILLNTINELDMK